MRRVSAAFSALFVGTRPMDALRSGFSGGEGALGGARGKEANGARDETAGAGCFQIWLH